MYYVIFRHEAVTRSFHGLHTDYRYQCVVSLPSPLLEHLPKCTTCLNVTSPIRRMLSPSDRPAPFMTCVSNVTSSHVLFQPSHPSPPGRPPSSRPTASGAARPRHDEPMSCSLSRDRLSRAAGSSHAGPFGNWW